LIGIVGAVAATSRWRPALGTSETFALYGALHAFALVVSLRQRRSRARAMLFILAAAAISAVSALLGLDAIHYLGRLPAVLGPALVVAFAAGFGAVCYAILIRHCWDPELSNRAVVCTACGCIAAALFVLLSGLLPKTPDGLWFAVMWWFAFSAALAYQDGRTARDR
jgi:hypothetical protein